MLKYRERRERKKTKWVSFMDAGDTWSMLRCAGGAQDKTIINRLMLRFRPIAPKPTVGEPFPGNPGSDNKSLLLVNKRSKRKYVRVCKNNTRKKDDNNNKNNYNNKNSSSDQERSEQGVVTLQLLPESGDECKEPRHNPPSSSDLDPTAEVMQEYHVVDEENQNPPTWLEIGPSATDPTGPVESWVTVECVTDACMSGAELNGSSSGTFDVERIMEHLERDTCPGFISDGSNRVSWVNGAYRRMIGVTGPDGEVAVRLVVKEKLPWQYAPFSCQARVQYNKCQKMVPCDVWRMDFNGGLAWRLDIKAALSLGL